MNRGTPFSYIVAVLTVGLSLAVSSGCARGMLTAIFVSHDSSAEIDMLRVVESPPGHLSGSLVISTLNSDGSRKADTVYDVTGTITGANVSLQPEGGLVGLAHFFGAATNLVGTLSGSTLTLSIGNNTVRFHEMSQRQYEAELGNLEELGRHLATVARAKTAIQEAQSSSRELNSDLKSYIGWGQERVDHVPGVRRWYADRIERYGKCLESIRPLAAAHVESWRWQDCVLDIENDKYDRDQEAESIRDSQSQNQDTVARLDGRIKAAQQEFPKVLDAIRSACPYANNVSACKEELQKLAPLAPDGFLDDKLIATFRRFVPQVRDAINADIQVSNQEQARLSSIAQQVERLYQSAK